MSRDTSKILKKFTGLEIPEDRLWNVNASPVVRMMVTTIEEINGLEREMIRAANQLRDLANKVEAYVDAAPGQPVRHLNPSGEMQGSSAGRIEMTIASHAEKVNTLNKLAHIYKIEAGLIDA